MAHYQPQFQDIDFQDILDFFLRPTYYNLIEFLTDDYIIVLLQNWDGDLESFQEMLTDIGNALDEIISDSNIYLGSIMWHSKEEHLKNYLFIRDGYRVEYQRNDIQGLLQLFHDIIHANGFPRYEEAEEAAAAPAPDEFGVPMEGDTTENIKHTAEEYINHVFINHQELLQFLTYKFIKDIYTNELNTFRESMLYAECTPDFLNELQKILEEVITYDNDLPSKILTNHQQEKYISLTHLYTDLVSYRDELQDNTSPPPPAAAAAAPPGPLPKINVTDKKWFNKIKNETLQEEALRLINLLQGEHAAEDILNIPRETTDKSVIKEAYRKLVKLFHPDKLGKESKKVKSIGEQLIKHINNANDKLTNAEATHEFKTTQNTNLMNNLSNNANNSNNVNNSNNSGSAAAPAPAPEPPRQSRQSRQQSPPRQSSAASAPAPNDEAELKQRLEEALGGRFRDQYDNVIRQLKKLKGPTITIILDIIRRHIDKIPNLDILLKIILKHREFNDEITHDFRLTITKDIDNFLEKTGTSSIDNKIELLDKKNGDLDKAIRSLNVYPGVPSQFRTEEVVRPKRLTPEDKLRKYLTEMRVSAQRTDSDNEVYKKVLEIFVANLGEVLSEESTFFSDLFSFWQSGDITELDIVKIIELIFDNDTALRMLGMISKLDHFLELIIRIIGNNIEQLRANFKTMAGNSSQDFNQVVVDNMNTREIKTIVDRYIQHMLEVPDIPPISLRDLATTVQPNEDAYFDLEFMERRILEDAYPPGQNPNSPDKIVKRRQPDGLEELDTKTICTICQEEILNEAGGLAIPPGQPGNNYTNNSGFYGHPVRFPCQAGHIFHEGCLKRIRDKAISSHQLKCQKCFSSGPKDNSHNEAITPQEIAKTVKKIRAKKNWKKAINKTKKKKATQNKFYNVVDKALTKKKK